MTSVSAPSDLDRLHAYASVLPESPALPLAQWNPPFCGDIDIHINHNGVWYHNGMPILRQVLVQLFARILRKEADGYRLVTPVEKVGITVADVPFIAVEMTANDGALTLRTTVGDVVTAGPGHPLRFETGNHGDFREGDFRPYVEMRHGLFARLSRSLTQDLVALGEIRPHNGSDWFGVTSAGVFFPITSAEALGMDIS